MPRSKRGPTDYRDADENPWYLMVIIWVLAGVGWLVERGYDALEIIHARFHVAFSLVPRGRPPSQAEADSVDSESEAI